jgi:uncharacterized protein YuzE
MADVRVWYDREGDYLEVTFVDVPGYFREIGEDIFERVDTAGRVIGFAIFNFTHKDHQDLKIPLALERLADASTAVGSL